MSSNSTENSCALSPPRSTHCHKASWVLGRLIKTKRATTSWRRIVKAGEPAREYSSPDDVTFLLLYTNAASKQTRCARICFDLHTYWSRAAYPALVFCSPSLSDTFLCAQSLRSRGRVFFFIKKELALCASFPFPSAREREKGALTLFKQCKADSRPWSFTL